jgi:2',3'-cyclic-nucleotide 2'-phosphodiesterase (5'-nucleotidase family)
MNRARLFAYVVAIGLSAGALAIPIASVSVSARKAGTVSTAKSVAVMYTSQVYGQVRSCNCTKFRYGGYGRQATLMGQVAKESTGAVLIECGDALGGGSSEQEKLKTDLTIKVIPLIGYAAYVPGETEIVADLRKVKAGVETQGVPMVCANVFDSKSGERICSAYTIHKTSDGVRVAIVGLLGGDLIPDEVVKSAQIKVGDGASLLKKIAPGLRKQSDLIVVVAHMSADKAKAIADLGIGDIVICSHVDKKLIMPAKDQNTIDAPFSSEGHGLFIESLTRSNWSVGRLDMKRAGAGKWAAASNKLLYLDRAYAEDPRIVKLFDDYSAKVTVLTLQQRADLRAEVEKKIRARGLDPDKLRERNRTFTGDQLCGTCHKKEHEVWAASRHSHAMDTLKKTSQEFDPECVGCHSTGHNERGGFVNLKETPSLANVQCESCHGAGKAHAAKPAPKFGPSGEVTCRGCHTDELSPDFNYEAMWKKIAH